MVATNGQVLKAIEDLRKDIAELTVLLIGSADCPDKPGVMERLRMVETWKGTTSKRVNWAGGIVFGAVLADIVIRFIAWYKQ